jgi:hypothetical protein
MQVKAKQMSRMPKEQADKMVDSFIISTQKSIIPWRFFFQEIPFPKPTETDKDKIVDMEEIGSKEERRKRKKKIEVTELFRCYKKRPSNESGRDGGGTPNELILKEEEKDSVVEAASTSTQPLPVVQKKKKKKKEHKEKKERTLIKDHGNPNFDIFN